MRASELLTTDRIISSVSVSSKKRALEVLSTVLAESVASDEISELDIFDGLLARERLGSTGLGHGVAIPHGRFKHLDHAVAALIKLDSPVDYDAVDDEPVDLLFCLMVPEQSTDEHLQLLASVAEMFRDGGFRNRLRQALSTEEIEDLIAHWHPADHKVASSL